MKTIRIAESGAIKRLEKFFTSRSAAMADRLQQVLDQYTPTNSRSPAGNPYVGEGLEGKKFTVEPIPGLDTGQEMSYVTDESGNEFTVDTLSAIQYLSQINQASLDAVFEALNNARGDVESEDEWTQQMTGRRADVSNETWDRFERLRELMGDQMLLEELVRAMSGKEAQENFDHIIQMHDLGRELGEEEEEEEQEIDMGAAREWFRS
jgi:hypothetical protein